MTAAPTPARPTAGRRLAVYRAHVVSELAQNARMPAFVLPLLAYPVRSSACRRAGRRARGSASCSATCCSRSSAR